MSLIFLDWVISVFPSELLTFSSVIFTLFLSPFLLQLLQFSVLSLPFGSFLHFLLIGEIFFFFHFLKGICNAL